MINYEKFDAMIKGEIPLFALADYLQEIGMSETIAEYVRDENRDKFENQLFKFAEEASLIKPSFMEVTYWDAIDSSKFQWEFYGKFDLTARYAYVAPFEPNPVRSGTGKREKNIFNLWFNNSWKSYSIGVKNTDDILSSGRVGSFSDLMKSFEGSELFNLELIEYVAIFLFVYTKIRTHEVRSNKELLLANKDVSVNIRGR